MPKKQGRKDDHDKMQWDLLPWNEVEEIVDVLTFGAKKYSAWNWLKVPNGKSRYFAAAMRHLMAYWKGELKDPESGISHIAHAQCCLLFLAYKENEVTDVK